MTIKAGAGRRFSVRDKRLFEISEIEITLVDYISTRKHVLWVAFTVMIFFLVYLSGLSNRIMWKIFSHWSQSKANFEVQIIQYIACSPPWGYIYIYKTVQSWNGQIFDCVIQKTFFHFVFGPDITTCITIHLSTSFGKSLFCFSSLHRSKFVNFKHDLMQNHLS